MKKTLLGGLAALALTAAATPALADGPLSAAPDEYKTKAGQTLTVKASHGVLRNDSDRGLQIVANSQPANGTLKLDDDGAITYVPNAGFTGDDTFSYSVSDAVHLFKADVPPLAVVGGVTLTGGAYGSGLAARPGHADEFYGLTDRGPNVDLPDGSKGEPLPDFNPAIGLFHLRDGVAQLKKTIPLSDAQGHPYNGQVTPDAPTGEVIKDLNGNTLPASVNGYDSEGLAVQADGSFWVSDEYGPFITHFTNKGRAIERLSPFDGSLPAELKYRIANKGMEGLTLTPDGRTLVGVMQSALQQPDLGSTNAKNQTPVRIVTVDLATRKTREFVFLLDNPKTTGTTISEITALTDTTFLLDQRDGSYVGPGAYKQLWKIDLTGATDVGPANPAYTPTAGILVNGRSVELTVKGQDTPTSRTTLTAAGIVPVTASLQLDVTKLLLGLDPAARFFSHDKIEGVSVVDGKIVLSNDNDFGIDGATDTTAPFGLHPKISPTTGLQDNGEYLVIDPSKSATPVTATVTVHVG